MKVMQGRGGVTADNNTAAETASRLAGLRPEQDGLLADWAGAVWSARLWPGQDGLLGLRPGQRQVSLPDDAPRCGRDAANRTEAGRPELDPCADCRI